MEASRQYRKTQSDAYARSGSDKNSCHFSSDLNMSTGTYDDIRNTRKSENHTSDSDSEEEGGRSTLAQTNSKSRRKGRKMSRKTGRVRTLVAGERTRRVASFFDHQLIV